RPDPPSLAKRLQLIPSHRSVLCSTCWLLTLATENREVRRCPTPRLSPRGSPAHRAGGRPLPRRPAAPRRAPCRSFLLSQQTPESPFPVGTEHTLGFAGDQDADHVDPRSAIVARQAVKGRKHRRRKPDADRVRKKLF